MTAKNKEQGNKLKYLSWFSFVFSFSYFRMNFQISSTFSADVVVNISSFIEFLNVFRLWMWFIIGLPPSKINNISFSRYLRNIFLQFKEKI